MRKASTPPAAAIVSPSGDVDRDRLRALTGAVIAVGAGLELDDVLQRLVTTAATFSGARYGALGITDANGHVVKFITHGISPELRVQLGRMPAAHGVPGALLRPGSSALRLSAISEHPASVGFPEHHPPMRTFLGVPVRVSGTVFGNLYVAEKRSAAGADDLFTAEDEEALLALGAAAGVAVENARLYTSVRRQQAWSDALGRAIHAIIARSDRDARARLAPVPVIAQGAAQCDLALLAFRHADGAWQVHYVGNGAHGAANSGGTSGAAPEVGSVVGRWVPEAVLERLAPDEVIELGPSDLDWLPDYLTYGLLVPVGGTGQHPEECLLLAYSRAPDPALGRIERTSELSFGQRLGLAVQVAQAQADSSALTLLRDRDRIARDLHDLVIQRLFAIGLSLQSAGVAARVPEVQGRLHRAVDDIDETIKDVRRTIFELHADVPRSGLRERVDRVLADVGEGLPADVEVLVAGGLEDLRAELAVELLAVLREALTNVARHAKATSVHIYITASDELELEVVDDGVGISPSAAHGEGLPNLATRATALEGSFEISAGPDGGTVCRWAVPLP